MLQRWLPVLAALALLAPPALAEEACDDTVEVDRFRYLRQLSLDLLGRVPTEGELLALADREAVTEADVDALLESDEFFNFVRRYHKDLLWPSNEALDILGGAVALLLPAAFYEGSGDTQRLFLIYVGLYQRGGLVPCKDEPAEWDEDGNLVFEPMPDGTVREGWVMVEPYWAPGTEVKVCAAEASLAEVANNGALCNTVNGMFSGTCGCGPNLENCGSIPVVLEMTQALQDQLLRQVEAPIREGRPYTDMLRGRQEEVNGPIAHYYRHLAPMGIDPIILVPPVPPAELADIPYTDRAWRTVERGPAQHSGLLTSMSYLLRFQTGRARANRFHDAFLCDPFVAPPDGLPSPNDPCSDEPNLRERCGCNYCHSRLEPASAYWGRFADAGTLYLDPAQYPSYLARCAACARDPDRQCDFICQRFYVSEIGHDKQAPYAGVLRSYEFRDQAEIDNLEAGPEKLVAEAIESGRLASCVAEKLFTRLYQRAPTADEKAFDLPRHAQAFTASGYDFKALVKALVTDPAYRRMVR